MIEKPVVVITGAPVWAQWAAPLIDAQGFAPVRYETHTGYVTRLADDHAALLLVDGDSDDWAFWTATPKSSPATRRIPLVFVSANADLRARSLASGADVALAPEEMLTHLPALLTDIARVQNPAQRAELERQCAEPLPAQALEGVKKFNAGEFYKQHDLFEALWVAEQGPVRDLYRAILQVGVAYYQILRGSHRGALKMLLRSVQWLLILPDECQGVDVRQLRIDAARVRAELERLGPAGMDAFDRGLLRPVKRVGAPQDSGERT